MEEEKKQTPPRTEGGNRENGQRIAVRAGNFVPPAGAGENAQNRHRPRRHGGKGPGPRPGEARNGENRNGDNRGSAPRPGEARNGENRNGDNRGSAPRPGENRNGENRGPLARSGEARNGDNRGSASRPGENRNGDNRGPANRNGGNRPFANGARPESRGGGRFPRGGRRREPELSAALQRELDEEFSAPLQTPASGAVQERSEEAVESDAFAVDIATAGYLVEDIPTGFPPPGTAAVEVIGVRFRHAGKVYFFDPGRESFRVGESAVVDTARGPELGEVVMPRRRIAERDIVQPLRRVLRRASEKDLAHEAENRAREREALKICAAKIAAHKLDMKLVDAQYAFDNTKLLFYFTSEGRVDFRELVRDLAGVFRTRIELRQIGIRDESRLIGGLGMCGRPFCCTTFLSDFGQVSIKMAKEQGLSINTSKISGCCGRLMCCLRYEHETYAEENKRIPQKGAAVMTPDGPGTVVESAPIAGTVKVRLADAPDEAPRTYPRAAVTVEGRAARDARRQEDGRAVPKASAPADPPAAGTEEDARREPAPAASAADGMPPASESVPAADGAPENDGNEAEETDGADESGI